MKKIDFIIVICAILALMSCGNKTTSREILEEEDSLMAADNDTLLLNRSTYSSTNEYAGISLSFSFPNGKNEVEKKIRKSLATLLENTVHNLGVNEGTNDIKKYFSKKEDLDSLVKYYGKEAFELAEQTSQSDHAVLLEDFAADENKPEPMQYTLDYNILKSAENDKYITFCENSYVFWGGAHGSSYGGYHTYKKSDGTEVTKFLKPGSEAKMQKLLKDGCREYFRGCEMEVDNDEQLYDCLLLESKTIPLPTTAIHPCKSGFGFIYQQYEIAPYSAGEVNFIIPFDQIMPYLTDEAKELIGRE